MEDLLNANVITQKDIDLENITIEDMKKNFQVSNPVYYGNV